MGIIKRQSIKRVAVQYTGVIIGFLATVLVYSQFPKFYGLANFVSDAALLLSFFMLLGINNLSLNYFSLFSSSTKQINAFFSLIIYWASIGILISLFIFLLLKDFIKPYLINANDPLFSKYIFWSLPIAVLVSYKGLISMYIYNYKRIVINNVIDNLFPKIALPAIILLTAYFGFSNERFLGLIIAMNAVVLVLLLVYLHSLNPIKLTKIKGIIPKSKFKEMGVYAFFGLFGALGHFLAVRIDTLFVAKYVDTTSVGVYKIMSYFSLLIDVPFSAIIAISAPIISEHIKKEEWTPVGNIFRDSSFQLLLVSLLLFLMISLNIEDLFTLMPFDSSINLEMSFFVVTCLAFAKLIDASTSVNSHIIVYSKFYKFNFYTILILGISNVGLDYYLVPIYGLRGAAVATAISLFLYNLIKIIYIKYRFGLWPFTVNSLNILLIGFITFVIIISISLPFHPIINIGLRGFLIIICYGVPIYLLGYVDPIISGLKETIVGLYRSVFSK